MQRRPVGTVYLLKRAELAVRSCMDVALMAFGLTPAQFLLLFRLRHHAELSGAALARDVGVRPQSIVGLIRPLERAGLLVRKPSPVHGRVLQMRLTAAGRKRLQQAIRVAARIESELLADLGAREIAALQEALTRLRSRAETHPLHPGSIRSRAERLMREQMAVTHRRSSKRGVS
jgi:DNA-binding MarR family transcriptional regulator